VEVNKGTALLMLMERHGLKGGIYLGDDISDVAAFSAIRSARLKGLALGVIGQETPHQVEKEADFTLNGVRDVERFLRWLAETVPGLRR
jgi:trehalose-phosphatase